MTITVVQTIHSLCLLTISQTVSFRPQNHCEWIMNRFNHHFKDISIIPLLTKAPWSNSVELIAKVVSIRSRMKYQQLWVYQILPPELYQYSQQALQVIRPEKLENWKTWCPSYFKYYNRNHWITSLVFYRLKVDG